MNSMVRLGWAGIALTLLGGCATSRPTRQVALVPLPGLPASIRGSPGVGLAGRIALANPVGGQLGDAVAVPSFQPELNSVVKFAENFYGTMNIVIAPGGATRAPRNDLPVVQAAFDLGALVGVGWDLRITPPVGITFSAEIGATLIETTTNFSSGSSAVGAQLDFAARASAAPFVEFGPVRVFSAVSIGTDTFSQEQGIDTTVCGSFCSSSNTAVTDIAPILILGGGARYQALPYLSFALEAWIPVTTAGVRQPPQLVVSAQLGNFDFSRSKLSNCSRTSWRSVSV